MASIPKGSKDVTKEWLQDVFLSHGKEVKVRDVQPLAADAGVFSSRFHARITWKQNEHDSTQDIFIKIMPDDVGYNNFVANNNLHVTEVGFYRSFWTDLKLFYNKRCNNNIINSIAPLHYHSDCKDSLFFLLLENISSYNVVVDFNDGLQEVQIMNAVKKIACFHVASFCYGKLQNINFVDNYSFFCKFHKKLLLDGNDFQKQIDVHLAALRNYVTKYSATMHFEKYICKLEVNNNLGKRFSILLTELGHDFVIHGDLWINNLMVNTNGDVKFVDWQFLTVGSIFMDFGLLAYLSIPLTYLSMPSEEINKLIESFVKCYYDEFCNTFSVLKCETLIPWDYSEFHDLALKQGMFFTLIWCCMCYDLSDVYPGYIKRTLWILQKCIDVCPEYFE